MVCSGRNRPQDSKGPCADAEGAAFVGGGDEPEQRTDDRHGRVACEKRSGVEHLGAGALQRLRPPPRVSGDPRQSRHHVEPRALGDEQHLGAPDQLGYDVSACHGCPSAALSVTVGTGRAKRSATCPRTTDHTER